MSDIKDKNIAVVGVSQREEKFGFRIFRDLM
jgi:predicted CoA-binding protein